MIFYVNSKPQIIRRVRCFGLSEILTLGQASMPFHLLKICEISSGAELALTSGTSTGATQVIMERSALPALLLTLLLGLLMQAMLAGASFASEQIEWIYRSLYVLAVVLSLGAIRRVNPPSFRSATIMLMPSVAAVLATWLIIEDAPHAAVMLFVLPVVHSLIAAYLYLVRPEDLRH